MSLAEQWSRSTAICFSFLFCYCTKAIEQQQQRTTPICTARAEFPNQKGYQTFKTYTRQERQPPLATSSHHWVLQATKTFFPPSLLTNVQITGSKWTWTGACDKIMIVELVIGKRENYWRCQAATEQPSSRRHASDQRSSTMKAPRLSSHPVLKGYTAKKRRRKGKETKTKKKASANQTPQDAVNVLSAAGRKAVFPLPCSAPQGHMSEAEHCPSDGRSSVLCCS